MLYYTCAGSGSVRSQNLHEIPDRSGRYGNNIMLVDTTNLVPKSMQKYGDWRGTRFYTDDGVLVYKTCLDCRTILSLDLFSKHKSAKDGLRNQCRDCLKKLNSDAYRRRTANNPNYSKEASARGRNKNSSRTHQEMLDDRLRVRPLGSKICLTCRSYLNLDMFHKCMANEDGLQDRCIDCRRKRKWEKKRGVYEENWKSLEIPNVCYLYSCDDPNTEVDHVVPSALNGPDELDNLLPLCKKHNASKQHRTLLKWLSQYYPNDLLPTLSKVLSYGVSPWTYLDSPEEIEQILTELEQYQSSVL